MTDMNNMNNMNGMNNANMTNPDMNVAGMNNTPNVGMNNMPNPGVNDAQYMNNMNAVGMTTQRQSLTDRFKALSKGKKIAVAVVIAVCVILALFITAKVIQDTHQYYEAKKAHDEMIASAEREAAAADKAAKEKERKRYEQSKAKLDKLRPRVAETLGAALVKLKPIAEQCAYARSRSPECGEIAENYLSDRTELVRELSKMLVGPNEFEFYRTGKLQLESPYLQTRLPLSYGWYDECFIVYADVNYHGKLYKRAYAGLMCIDDNNNEKRRGYSLRYANYDFTDIGHKAYNENSSAVNVREQEVANR